MSNTAADVSVRQSPEQKSPGQQFLLVVWAGRIGSFGLVGLATAHAVTNARNFHGGGVAPWLLFLTFAVGLSVALAAIALVTWRFSRRQSGGRVARVIILLGAGFCLVTLVNVLRLHPEIIWNPAGPGPWVVIATPALWVTALAPSRRSSRRPRGPAAVSADASNHEGT